MKGQIYTAILTGFLVGLVFPTITMIPDIMMTKVSAALVGLFVPLFAVFTAIAIAKACKWGLPHMGNLFVIAYLTEMLPVLGPSFGRAGHLWEIPLIALLGAAGGALWSLPFGLWKRNPKTR
ncbi:hypothetical protein H8D30_03355 [bacterium]|nr:hypothetical protein [bacterium]